MCVRRRRRFGYSAYTSATSTCQEAFLSSGHFRHLLSILIFVFSIHLSAEIK
jgi:hypothetical protein